MGSNHNPLDLDISLFILKMRVFDNPNTYRKTQCLVCKKDFKHGEGPIVLVPMADTETGDTIQGRQIHLKCINLMLYEYEDSFIFIQEAKK
jgi:hypothetical protein